MMVVRFVVLTLAFVLGMAFVAIGTVILGVRVVDGAPIPSGVVVVGATVLLLGSLTLWLSVRMARRYPSRSLSAREVVLQGIVSLGGVAMLVISVLKYSYELRGAFFGTALAMLILAVLMVDRLMTTAKLGDDDARD